MNPVEYAIECVGGCSVAAGLLGISYHAVYKMKKNGVLPRSEYTGETNYAEILAAHSKGQVTSYWLLSQANPIQKQQQEQQTC